jgi:hypothetical protein
LLGIIACSATPASPQALTSSPLGTHLESLAAENPAAAFLEAREQLDLDASQVSRLEIIAQQLRRDNRELLDGHSEAIGAMTKESGNVGLGPGSAEQIREFRGVIARLRRNLTGSRASALAVFTAEQLERARELGLPVR